MHTELIQYEYPIVMEFGLLWIISMRFSWTCGNLTSRPSYDKGHQTIQIRSKNKISISMFSAVGLIATSQVRPIYTIYMDGLNSKFPL